MIFIYTICAGITGGTSAGGGGGPALRADGADAGPRRLHQAARRAHPRGATRTHPQHTRACQVSLTARYVLCNKLLLISIQLQY